MDFEKICMMFTMQEPYYGILLSSMNRVPVPASVCPTMGVRQNGNVFQLGYNPDFVNNLDVDTVLELLKHEVLHLAFNHFTLWENAPDTEAEQRMRNVAADLEVNCYINLKKMRGVNPLTVDMFGFDERQGTLEYYRLLGQMAQQQQQQQANQPQQPCNGGQGINSNQKQEQQNQNKQQQNQSSSSKNSSNQKSQQNKAEGQGQAQATPGQDEKQIPDNFLEGVHDFDDHSEWPDTDNKDERELMEQQIEDMLVFAADEVEKACGKIPGELQGKIKLIRDRKKPKPVANWKRYMRRYMGNEFSEFIRKSKKRESRRFPDAAGNKHRRKSHILIAIDTSGSVSMPEYQEFFGQIRTLMPLATFHVVECDARIQYEYDFRGKPNETLHGGGGTSFDPVIDLYIKHKRAYDALIYFTDGECYIPQNTPKDTLWVISSKGDQSSRARYQVNGASVAFIPKKQ